MLYKVTKKPPFSEGSINISSLDMTDLVLPIIFTKIAQFLHNNDVIRANFCKNISFYLKVLIVIMYFGKFCEKFICSLYFTIKVILHHLLQLTYINTPPTPKIGLSKVTHIWTLGRSSSDWLVYILVPIVHNIDYKIIVADKQRPIQGQTLLTNISCNALHYQPKVNLIFFMLATS